MITVADVSAVLVTRGNVDLDPILATLPYSDVVIWDNSKREDLGIYGRYAGIVEAKNPVIYVQDDDLIVRCHDQLLASYEPDTLVCNYPHPWDIPWVARGGLFDRDLPARAFARWDTMFERDRDFTHYMCDGVLAMLTPNVKVVDYGSEDLPYCNDPGRISTGDGWYNHRRPLIQTRCREVFEAGA